MTDEAEVLDHLKANLPRWRESGAIPAEDWRELAGRVSLGTTSLRETAGMIALLARTGDVGLVGAYAINEICHRMLILVGDRELPEPVRAGTARLALAITESGAGSDVSRLRTAVDAGSGTLSGEKLYISNSVIADYHIVAVRAGENAQFPVLSLYLVDSADLERQDMHGTGAGLMRLARVRLDRVPLDRTRLLGKAGRGFRHLNRTLDFERAVICVIAVEVGAFILREIAGRMREHSVFGARLADHGYHRLGFAEWAARGRTLALACETMIERFDQGCASGTDVYALKIEAGRYCRELAGYAQHLHGAAGWVSGGPLAGLHDDVRWLSLGGGADELLLTRIAQHDLDEK